MGLDVAVVLRDGIKYLADSMADVVFHNVPDKEDRKDDSHDGVGEMEVIDPMVAEPVRKEKIGVV
jgi:hypothetical protein